MFRYFLFLLVFINIHGIAIPQNITKIDTILLKLKYCQTCSETNLLIDLANSYLDNNDFEKAQNSANKALKIAKHEKNFKTEASVYAVLGNIQQYQYKFTEALIYYNKALIISDSINDEEGTASAYENMGLMNYYLGKNKEACEFYLESVPIFKSLGKKENLAKNYNIIGVIYDDWGDYKQAIEYYQQSLKLQEELNSLKGKANALKNIGTVYLKLKQFSKALEYYQKAFEINKELEDQKGIASSLNNLGCVYEEMNQYEKAIEYYIKARYLFQKLGKQNYVAISYFNIGGIYKKNNHLDQALNNTNMALNIYIKLNDEQGLAITYLQLGDILALQNNFSKSIEYYYKCLEIAKADSLQEKEMAVYKSLSDAYSLKGNYSNAYNFLKKYAALKDTMLNAEKFKLINDAQIKYEVDKTKKEIELLNKDKLLKEAELDKSTAEIRHQQQQKYTFVIGFALMLFLALLAYRSYRQKRKANYLLVLQKKEIETQNVELEKLSIVARKTINAVIIIDPDGTIEWVNEAFNTFYGYNIEEIKIYRGNDFIESSGNPYIKEQLKYCIENKKPIMYESENKVRDGSVKWVQTSLTPILNASQEVSKLVVVDTDISTLKNIEFELQLKNIEIEDTLKKLKSTQSQLIQTEKMAALGQLIAGIAHEINTPLGAIKSSGGNITETLQQVLNQLPDFFTQMQPSLHDSFFALMESAMQETQNISSKEERKYRKELSAWFEEKGMSNMDMVVDTLVDMGIYGNLEDHIALIKAENSLEIIQMAYKLTGLLRSSRTIQFAVDRASKVVFALKNFAHFDNTDEKVVSNVIDGIETVLTLYQNLLKHGVEIIRSYSDIPSILCYPDELNQVWTNVIHNAIQAMNNKGVLTIEVSRVEDEIVVSFKDTGCGIPDLIKEKIFDPFFTTKAQGEGSGLGLDIVRRIIDKHNGRIACESVPGNTKFSFFFKITI